MEKFWMVLRDGCTKGAVARHDTKESARSEAERLCRLNNERFIVLEAVEFVEIEMPFKWTSF